MIGLAAARELFAFNDWARDGLLVLAASLSDRQLDQPFAMGAGSLRATLQHHYGAERAWAQRTGTPGAATLPRADTLTAVADLMRAAQSLAGARCAWLATLSDGDLRRDVAYADRDGKTQTNALGDILLHVCNHGVHHRAQAVNMLRHIGAALPKSGLDYIFMKIEQSLATPPIPPPPLDLESVRTYYAYADWARDQVHGLGASLSDAQLDRPFEIGMGSVRATLAHIRNAEQWWLENWTLGPGRLFPPSDARVPVAELTALFDETRAARDRFLGGLGDADLLRPTTATPRPGDYRTFPLGVTMFQLCCHGTHHRAQVLNMFRQLGAPGPALDYITMLREQRPAH
jgi:uncharacterized damage-inducible protein DinB